MSLRSKLKGVAVAVGIATISASGPKIAAKEALKAEVTSRSQRVVQSLEVSTKASNNQQSKGAQKAKK